MKIFQEKLNFLKGIKGEMGAKGEKGEGIGGGVSSL